MSTTSFQFFRSALVFAAIKHGDQKRRYTGEPYIVHLIQVAALVANFGGSADMIRAALLHDVLEDTECSYDELEREAGHVVAQMVLALTDCSRDIGNRAARKAVDRHRLARSGGDVQTIKLADLLDNTASIVRHDPAFAKIYLAEKRLMLDALHDGHPLLKEAAERAWRQSMEQLNDGQKAPVGQARLEDGDR